MKLFGLLLLVAAALAAPASNEDDRVIVTERLFPKELSVYHSEHDIVNLYLPVDFDDDDDDDLTDDDDDVNLYFVLGDKTDDKIDYKGLYVLNEKNVHKVLDNGVDMTAEKNDTNTVYIGATDGIYKYNAKTKTTEKYGSVTDSVINIVKTKKDNVIYILTAEKTLYKLTDDGNKKTKIDDVKNAQQIVLDSSDNLYYYNNNKKIYIVNEHGVKEVTGLPAPVSEVTLLRPPFVIDDGIPAVINDDTYIIYANGTVETGDFVLKVKPTAYSVEGTLIQYYAYDKNIYEYNVLVLMLGNMLDELRNFLGSKQAEINTIAAQTRSDATRKLNPKV